MKASFVSKKGLMLAIFGLLAVSGVQAEWGTRGERQFQDNLVPSKVVAGRQLYYVIGQAVGPRGEQQCLGDNATWVPVGGGFCSEVALNGDLSRFTLQHATLPNNFIRILGNRGIGDVYTWSRDAATTFFSRVR